MAEPNWPAIKARFEKGEPPDKLAAAYKLPRKTIAGRARRDGWDKGLQPKLKRSSGAKPRTPAHDATPARKAVAEAITAAAASVDLEPLDPEAYIEQHRDDFQGLRQVAVTLLQNLGSLDPNAQARQLTAIASALKLVQDGQRKALNLDKSDTKTGANDLQSAIEELDRRGVPERETDDGDDPTT